MAFPWWLSLGLVFLGIFLYRNFYEAFLFAFVMDSVYSVTKNLFFEYATYLANVVVWATVLYYFYFAISFAARRDEYLKKIPPSFQFENSVNPSASTNQKSDLSNLNQLTEQPIASIQYPFLNIANSVAISVFMKDALKFMFGRYWPNTWSNNNPSLLHDHAYGFHYFHSGVAYQSFPSGHTTIVVAAATAIWLTYPRGPWRWLALVGALAVIIGLLAENYHFLGDCIAGAWVGAITAIYVTAYKQTKEVINHSRHSVPATRRLK